MTLQALNSVRFGMGNEGGPGSYALMFPRETRRQKGFQPHELEDSIRSAIALLQGVLVNEGTDEYSNSSSIQ